MKRQFVNELASGAKVDSTFALRSKELRATRAGDAFLSLELADSSGSIPAVLFRPQAVAVSVPTGSVIRARGTITQYRGRKRLSLESLVPADSWNPSELLPSAPCPVEDMQRDFADLVRSVAHSQLRALLRGIFGERAFYDRFCACPGSQSWHHAYIGGLLQHTIAVANLCSSLCAQYPDVDSDLLLTAALLHDVGKVEELSIGSSIEFTDEGRLLGHVVLGINRIRDGALKSRIRIDRQLLAKLEHAVLSHHGELEWGSPKRPSTIEALLLHHADNLDAKAAGFAAALRGATMASEAWTDADNLFRRPLHAPQPAEDSRQVRVPEELGDRLRSA